jgi:hypothetical protein
MTCIHTLTANPNCPLAKSDFKNSPRNVRDRKPILGQLLLCQLNCRPLEDRLKKFWQSGIRRMEMDGDAEFFRGDVMMCISGCYDERCMFQ